MTAAAGVLCSVRQSQPSHNTDLAEMMKFTRETPSHEEGKHMYEQTQSPQGVTQCLVTEPEAQVGWIL